MSAPPSPSVVAHELTRRFGAFVAVAGVSFELFPGEMVGYLGANGAGKSTTIRMLCGVLAPTSGRASVCGIDVATAPRALKRRIGYMSQRFSLYGELTVGENLAFFGGAYGLRGRALALRSEEVAERLGLAAQASERADRLPAGGRQRLALACAVLHEPGVLFLDEPTAGVDPISRQEFFKLVRAVAAAGTTVLVTTHHMDEVEYCDRVGVLVQGRLAALGASEALKRTHVRGRLALLHDLAPALRRRLHELPGFLRVTPAGADVKVEIGVDAWPVALATLSGWGIPSDRVEEQLASLEDVFLAVVSDAARRDGGDA